jgi:hypothetical protein
MSNLWHGFASPILNVLEYLEATFIHICPKKKKILMELPHVDMVWRKQTRLVGKDHTHGITLRKAQPKPDREKS